MSKPADSVCITLYRRAGCHLCDDMRDELEQLLQNREYRLQELDIDTDPQLQHRYGEKVPVLWVGDREICHFYLDPAAVTAAFNSDF